MFSLVNPKLLFLWRHLAVLGYPKHRNDVLFYYTLPPFQKTNVQSFKVNFNPPPPPLCRVLNTVLKSLYKKCPRFMSFIKTLWLFRTYVNHLIFVWLLGRFISMYIYDNITQQHPYQRCSGYVRAFWVRFDFTHRMQYSCIRQFFASKSAIRHLWTPKMQTRNILSTTTSQAMLYVHACMYQTCTHAHTPSFVPKSLLEWGSIKHLLLLCGITH